MAARDTTLCVVMASSVSDPVILPPGVNLVYGTSGNDNPLSGTIGRDAIFGYGGHDRLYGLGGNDSLEGGEGHDTLDGGSPCQDIHLGGLS